MAINITQFAPPSRVSSLVWDKNMEPPAGKVFEGDLVGDVTGDVTGDLTGVVRGSLLGYLSRNGVYSATKGALVVPASSSAGNVPTNVNLNLGGNGTYAIVGNTQKCFIDDPCNIPVALSGLLPGAYTNQPSYAKSYTSEGVLIDSINDSGNLNIYGAAYIVLCGGDSSDGESFYDRTMSVADAYIDAGTSLILGDDTPPDGPKVSKLVWDSDMVPAAGKKFKGALEGNVTGNVTGNLTGNVTGNLTGDVNGKINVVGCKWYNTAPEAIYLPITILTGLPFSSESTTLKGSYRVLNHPYAGAINFLPKTSVPFDVIMTLKSSGSGEFARIKLYSTAGDVLRTYEKTDIGSETFSVDLTDASYLRIEAIGGGAGFPSSVILPNLYVVTPGIHP